MSQGRRRRFWSDEEKRMITAQTRVPGVSVAQVSRRYDVNTNTVFKWLRDPRFRPLPEAIDFLPVEVVRETDLMIPNGPCTEEKAVPQAVQSGEPGCIVICVAGGLRLEISGFFDGDAVARLVKGLSS